MKNNRTNDEPQLDPEVAALVNACKTAEEERKARNRGIDWARDLKPDGKPTELKLKIGPTVVLSAGAGLLSALGGLVIFSWPDAGAGHLLLAQLPAAGLVAYAFAREEKKKAGSRG
jgi:hypothetical protein